MKFHLILVAMAIFALGGPTLDAADHSATTGNESCCDCKDKIKKKLKEIRNQKAEIAKTQAMIDYCHRSLASSDGDTVADQNGATHTSSSTTRTNCGNWLDGRGGDVDDGNGGTTNRDPNDDNQTGEGAKPRDPNLETQKKGQEDKLNDLYEELVEILEGCECECHNKQPV